MADHITQSLITKVELLKFKNDVLDGHEPVPGRGRDDQAQSQGAWTNQEQQEGSQISYPNLTGLLAS